MWDYTLFRVGALVLALHGIVHLFGHFANKTAKPVNSQEYMLEELLYGFKTNVMGVMRSQGEILDGLSLAFSLFLLTLAALGFTLPVEKKPAIVIAASLAVLLAISLAYWFVVPTAFVAVALLCFAGSAYLKK
jgi:hypothetical protein